MIKRVDNFFKKYKQCKRTSTFNFTEEETKQTENIKKWLSNFVKVISEDVDLKNVVFKFLAAVLVDEKNGLINFAENGEERKTIQSCANYIESFPNSKRMKRGIERTAYSGIAGALPRMIAALSMGKGKELDLHHIAQCGVFSLKLKGLKNIDSWVSYKLNHLLKEYDN